MAQQFEASVIEDNGGGLSLFVFGDGGIDGGTVIWGYCDYEYNPGSLSADIQALLNGDDPRSDWDGGVENPQAVYDQLTSYEYGWKSVAQVHGGKLNLHINKLHLFPNVMGMAARIEFGITED